MQMLRVAWRNLHRNRRRTVITVAAVAANTAILIASLALTEGMLLQMERSVTRLTLGDAQVHAVNYRKEQSMYLAVPEPAALLAAVAKAGADAAPRSYGFGLLSNGSKSAGVRMAGVDPEREARAFELAAKVKHGTWLGSTADRGVIIGRRLARSLHAEVGTELVAVVQAADGSTGADTFKVQGILGPVSEEVDRGALYMHAADFDEIFVADGRVHEIAIHLKEVAMADLRAAVAPTLGEGELMTWRELLPPLAEMLQMADASLLLFAAVFFLGAGLGVLNTMLMATHDRVREFGVIKALGGTPWRIIRDVTAEALVLGLIASAIGALLGIAGSVYMQAYGIDLSGFGEDSVSMAGLAWDTVMYAELTPGQVVGSAVTMIAASVLASLYPAIKAARMQPVHAMTHV